MLVLHSKKSQRRIIFYVLLFVCIIILYISPQLFFFTTTTTAITTEPAKPSLDAAWPNDAKWIRIKEEGLDLHLYSAYLEQSENQTSVRIIGVVPTNFFPAVHCRFLYEGHSIGDWTPLTVRLMSDHSSPYVACFMFCRGSTVHRQTVTAVEISRNSTSPSDSNAILRVHPLRNDPPVDELEVCVKPLFNPRYQTLLMFVEFIEFYSILGATHFTFYNESLSPDVSCTLAAYERQGLLQVLPWTLNVTNATFAHGQMASLNDCLYRWRSLGRRFIAFVDPDEYLIPGPEFPTLKQLIAKGFKDEHIGSLSFRNAFHFLHFPDDSRSDVLPESMKLITLTKTGRSDHIYPHKVRSKYIADSGKTEEYGVHYVLHFVNASIKPLELTSDQGLSHHYREKLNWKSVNEVRDSSAYRFKYQLLERVSERLALLRKECAEYGAMF